MHTEQTAPLASSSENLRRPVSETIGLKLVAECPMNLAVSLCNSRPKHHAMSFFTKQVSAIVSCFAAMLLCNL